MGYYNPPKPAKYNFDPKSTSPYKLSRTGLELFTNCPRCFYLDKRLGVGQPPGYPFSLNSAVDHLLKKEFNAHRAKNETHPLMKLFGIDAIPYSHKDLDAWRENFVGIQYLEPKSNLLITGAIDDVWIDNKTNQLIIVDYKATSKDEKVTLDADWQMSYKRQMEIYQWLFRKNGFDVSPTGYFVYCNGKKDRLSFDGKLEFDIDIIGYTGNSDWVDDAVAKAKKCLSQDSIPAPSEDCDYCKYRMAAKKFESQVVQEKLSF
jgi:CRISPR/Cas system-associated exonuclease Cas4 (RecB family)